MQATNIEKVELASYQLKDVDYIQYNQWEKSCNEDAELAPKGQQNYKAQGSQIGVCSKDQKENTHVVSVVDSI